MTLIQVVFYVWLFSVLGLLVLIWRDSTKRQREVQKALIDVALKSAEAARNAAEAARAVASALEKK